MIRAVIFDCFGVLVSDGWLPFKEAHFGNNAELMQQASDLSKQADSGFISYDDFITGIAELSGVNIEQVAAQIESNPPNEPLFAFIETLSQFKIGMLSNAPADWVNELFTSKQKELFDAIGLSYKNGFIKPDSRAYESIANELQVDPSECLFVDDQERFCMGAEDVGMRAVHFKDNQQAINEIKQLLTQS